MATVSVAGEWSLFSNRYYRKLEIYRMSWRKVELRDHVVACSPFGGPIAIVRDDSKVVQLHSEPARSKIQIFRSSGLLTASIPRDRPGGRLIALGWSSEEILHCVMEDGNVFRYSVHGKLLPGQIWFGQECWDQGVAECIIWGNGIVCLSKENELFCIPDLGVPREFVKLAKQQQLIGLGAPDCMAVIEPQHSGSGNVEVLLAYESGVVMVEGDSVQELGNVAGRLERMAPSPNGDFVACFTKDARVLVVPSDFSRTISEINSEYVLQSPKQSQLIWCGMDTVLLYLEDEYELLMVGPKSDSTTFYYDEPLVLIPECDGARILSKSSMEFLHRVPDSTLKIFSIGSHSSASMLYDAYDYYTKRSVKADEIIQEAKKLSMSEAIESCIDAAGQEFDIDLQETLMRAAIYGRTFCREFPKRRLRQMNNDLKVLDSVRHPSIGIPLTLKQYKELTVPVLIDRLINSHKHFLALKISERFLLNPERVVIHWACTKITLASASSVPDSDLCNFLIEMLKQFSGVSYASIASHALGSGRRTLAAMLLEHERRSSEQVPLLISMGEEETALTKAIKSWDTDLVYMTLFHIWQKKSPSEFTRVVEDKPLARDLFVVYARMCQPEVLKKFFASLGQPQKVGYILFWESWLQSKNPQLRQGSSLQGPRLRLIEEAQRYFSQTKENDFEAKVCEEQVRLLKIQQELEAKTGEKLFVDSSVSDTIRTCIVLGFPREAQRIRVEFKVPDKRFYWLKILGLSCTKNWDALEKFSKEKRPPIGYKPFVDVCIQEGARAEALKYIVKLSDPEEKAEAYAEIGMAKEAEEVAAQAKDSELLGRLKLTFGQSTTAAALFDTIRDRLSLQGG